jgi:hypothetical protein
LSGKEVKEACFDEPAECHNGARDRKKDKRTRYKKAFEILQRLFYFLQKFRLVNLFAH